MVNLADQSIEELSDLDFLCSCWERHKAKIGDIKIGSGALSRLTELLGPFTGKKILLVADENTYKVAGEAIFNMLSPKFSLKRFVYEDNPLVADEKSIGALLMEFGLGGDFSLILTIGSGTLNDISRFVSAKTKTPYIIVATASSMDGYASVVSPLIRKGVKTTFKGVYPIGIIGDTRIMKDAPIHMLQAGLGDVLGKYTGLADWKMSKIMGLVRDEPYCDNILDLVETAVKKCTKEAHKLPLRDEDSIGAVMEGLVISGLCIGLAGHSRPASGSEHQIAHYIEMKYLQGKIHTKWLHGNKVGVATLAVLESYNYLFGRDLDEIIESGKYKEFDKSAWEERIKRTYGTMAHEIISFKGKWLLTDLRERQERTELIKEKWEEMKTVCFLNLPRPDDLISIQERAAAVYSPKELGIGRQLFKDALMVAKEIRNRYGIMQLLDDLGMLEEAAEFITAKYYDR